MSQRLSSRRAVALLVPVALLFAACGDDDDAAQPEAQDQSDAASVSFVSPGDGDRVAGGVVVEMAAEGLVIEPAGEVHEGAGHFHVIADDGCVDPGEAVARDVDHVHFGKGQTEGKVYLGPGEHELCLQPGDGAHVALDLTDRLTIQVGVESRAEWCGVVEEVDDLFTVLDSSNDEFAVQQVQYEGITRLLAQATEALEQVDPDVRDEVGRALAGASAIAGAFASAPDAASVEAELEKVDGPEGSQPSEAAAAWIQGTCQVDINS